MKQVSISNANLMSEMPQTYLVGDTAAGVSSITVKNITGFAINQILIIGEIGNEGTEMIKTHTSTAPTGSTITLGANTVFAHSAGTQIRVMIYDQVRISSAATIGGIQTILDTIYVTMDNDYTTFTDNTLTTGYYYSRFVNSLTGAYSIDSDAIPVGGYTPLSARLIIDNALEMINKESSPLLNDTFCYHQLNNCQEEVLREYKRWSFLQVFAYGLGELTTGQWKIALPINCDDQNTNKTIWNFKIGVESNMAWVDRQKWNDIIKGIAHTTLVSNIVVGAGTVTLTDSSDFGDGGSIYVGENIYGFNVNNRTTNTLTLETSATTTNTAGEDVFQNATLGLPRYWTVYDGYVYFYPVLGSTYNNKNAYLDYYKVMTVITNDTDQIVLTDPTVAQYYLAWKMMLRINNGVEDNGSKGMYLNYITRREKLKTKEVLGRSFSFKPQLNQIAVNDNMDEKQVRTGNFSQS